MDERGDLIFNFDGSPKEQDYKYEKRKIFNNEYEEDYQTSTLHTTGYSDREENGEENSQNRENRFRRSCRLCNQKDHPNLLGCTEFTQFIPS